MIKSYGLAPLPGAFNRTRGRREVEELTGNRWVPTLVLDDGTVIDESHAIVDWAAAEPRVALARRRERSIEACCSPSSRSMSSSARRRSCARGRSPCIALNPMTPTATSNDDDHETSP